MDQTDVTFARGFQWAGSFVKHGLYRGRAVAFRLSPQLVANCLEPGPGVVGPVATVAAHEPAVENACRRATARLTHAISTIDLQRHDFDAAA